VSTFVASIASVDTAESPAREFTKVGRLAAAATLVLGAGFQLAAFVTMPDFEETADRLQWIDDHATRAETSKVFDILAMPFLFGTVIVYVLLARRRSPRLAYAGGILLALGMVGLSMSQGFEALEFALSDDPRFDPATVADLVDNVSTAPVILFLVMFLVGAFFGLLITASALFRSRAVPRGAVALIPLFILVDLVLSAPLPGHVISFVGAAWIAVVVLRTPAGDT
jgi:hypothetical protein